MEQIVEEIMKVVDEKTSDISQSEYKDVLEGLLSDLQSRLDAVEQELENEGLGQDDM